MRAAVVLRNAAKAGQSAAASGTTAPMSADQSLYHLEPEVSCFSAGCCSQARPAPPTRAGAEADGPTSLETGEYS